MPASSAACRRPDTCASNVPSKARAFEQSPSPPAAGAVHRVAPAPAVSAARCEGSGRARSRRCGWRDVAPRGGGAAAFTVAPRRRSEVPARGAVPLRIAGAGRKSYGPSSKRGLTPCTAFVACAAAVALLDALAGAVAWMLPFLIGSPRELTIYSCNNSCMYNCRVCFCLSVSASPPLHFYDDTLPQFNPDSP